MAKIELAGIGKSFGSVKVIEEFDLTIADGEFVVLVGPSGCGKSTTLRILAGLETPSQGRIRIGGRDVTDLPPGERDIAMVFQNYALYPHMTVAENMSFALRLRKAPKDQIDRAVADAARILHIEPLLHRKPKELSGGQRQRVAMGRAIVRAPSAFLFDEPLSNLDAQLRGHMRVEIALLQKRLGGTVVYVTHDQVEAMTLADRIVVFDKGRIQQIGSPEDVFERPANLFVARFIGHPTINVVAGNADAGGVSLAGGAIRVPARHGSVPTVEAAFRPQSLRLAPGDPAGFDLDVDIVEYLGTETVVTGHLAEAPNVSLSAILPGRQGGRGRERLRFALEPDAVHLFDAQTGRNLAA